jgi:hypothetical protein
MQDEDQDQYFTLCLPGEAPQRFRVRPSGTIVVDESDPQDGDPASPKYDPFKPSGSTRRNHRLRDLEAELPTLPENSPRRAEVMREIAFLRPIVTFERSRFFRARPGE